MMRGGPAALRRLAAQWPLLAVLALGLWGLRPFGIGSDYWSAVVVMAGIYMLLAMGLNTVVGYAGLLDLGYAGFWAVGAYAAAILTGKGPIQPIALDFWSALPLAVLAAVASGLLLGIVTLRVRGDYLAIITLGFGEMVRIAANAWDSLTNGPAGITGIEHPRLLGQSLGLEPSHYVPLIWACIGGLGLLIGNLRRSRVGRAWHATRQDEEAAETLGVPTFRMKLLAFALGASTAGFAGAIYGAYVGFIAPANFTLLTAIMVLAAVVLGGMGSMRGAMLGAAAVVFLPELFRDLDRARYLAFGIILVAMMVLRPAGLLPPAVRRYRLPAAAEPGLAAAGRPSEGDGPLLRIQGLTHRFGGLRALDGIDLALPSGGISALIGPNGAGKSTLLDLVSGRLRPQQGSLALAGRRLARLSPHRVAALGVARTFQQIRLVADVTVAENVLLGADLRGGAGALGLALAWPPARAAERRALAAAAAALAFCDIAHLADRLAGALAYGDQRRVEIARALATRPRLLLLDEPAAGMNAGERQALQALIRRIAATGITVVLVEHDLDLVMATAARILVLDRGRLIADGPPERVHADPAVLEAYLGRAADAADAPSPRRPGPGPGAPPVLAVRGLRVAYGPVEAVRGIDLEVGPGEIVALIGANGAGKTSTLLALSGVQRAAAGAILLGGEAIERRPAAAIAAAGVAHVPEGRRIFPRMTVWENLVMGGHARGAPPDAADLERVFALFPVLRERLGQPGGTLSGGEQQMLAMARAIVARPRLLLLDEPTMGLAPPLAALVLQTVGEIAAAGTAILLVEQNAALALALADRACVMERGRIRLSGPAAALSLDREVRALYLGSPLPRERERGGPGASAPGG